MKSIEEYENPQLFAINFLEIRLEIFPAKECNHYTVQKANLMFCTFPKIMRNTCRQWTLINI